jgi:hypothetical protein
MLLLQWWGLVLWRIAAISAFVLLWWWRRSLLGTMSFCATVRGVRHLRCILLDIHTQAAEKEIALVVRNCHSLAGCFLLVLRVDLLASD